MSAWFTNKSGGKLVLPNGDEVLNGAEFSADEGPVWLDQWIAGGLIEPKRGRKAKAAGNDTIEGGADDGDDTLDGGGNDTIVAD